MKSVFDSDVQGFSESASRVIVYELGTPEELNELNKMDYKDLCDFLGLVDESRHYVAPGEKYHTYDFLLCAGHLVVAETSYFNV